MRIGNDEIGAVVDALYAMVSGPAGSHDMSRAADILDPSVRLMRVGADPQGAPTIQVFSWAEHSAMSADFLAQNDFYEVEIDRRIDVFGNIAQVWSRYETRNAPDGPGQRRGINAIQLVRQPDGLWRIVSVLWDEERPGLAIVF